jgi:transcriptional regulator with PAS, ATPase and Fis domain
VGRRILGVFAHPDDEVFCVGGTMAIPVDVRVIAATNRVLTKLVLQGSFRQDLYYRLNVIPLTIPPLRERKEDIPLLVEHLLERLSVETGKRIESVSEEAMSHLLDHDWPGNVRELRNVLERGIVLASGTVLRPENLGALGDGQRGEKTPLSLEQVERRHIASILRQTAGNVSQAARRARSSKMADTQRPRLMESASRMSVSAKRSTLRMRTARGRVRLPPFVERSIPNGRLMANIFFLRLLTVFGETQRLLMQMVPTNGN